MANDTTWTTGGPPYIYSTGTNTGTYTWTTPVDIVYKSKDEFIKFFKDHLTRMRKDVPEIKMTKFLEYVGDLAQTFQLDFDLLTEGWNRCAHCDGLTESLVSTVCNACQEGMNAQYAAELKDNEALNIAKLYQMAMQQQHNANKYKDKLALEELQYYKSPTPLAPKEMYDVLTKSLPATNKNPIDSG